MNRYYNAFPLEFREQFEIHEEVKRASSSAGVRGRPLPEYDERQREFSIPQFTQAVWDAIENWDWEAEGDFGLRMLSALVGIDEDYVAGVFADDDGVVRIDRAYNNVWDKIDEFARATAATL